MSIRTFLGPIAGTVIAVGGVATPLGDYPSRFVLLFSGVTHIDACLQFMKDQTSSGYANACAPLTDLSGLPLISNVIAFICLLAVVWGIVDLIKKLSS